MKSQSDYALAHPVYAPERGISTRHYWAIAPDMRACLTVNIGME